MKRRPAPLEDPDDRGRDGPQRHGRNQTIEEATDADIFLQVLVSALKRGDVVMMDNLSSPPPRLEPKMPSIKPYRSRQGLVQVAPQPRSCCARLPSMPLILVLVILILLFGGGGYYMGPGIGYYGGGGLSLVLALVVIYLVLNRGRTRL